MIIDFPDAGIILVAVLAFLSGLVTMYLYGKTRSVGVSQKIAPTNVERIDYYEKELIDMKIRLDAMELDTENSELPNNDKVNEELTRPQKRKQEVGSMEMKSHGTARIPNMSLKDSIEHVLKLITEKPMTSRDIKDRCGGRSREHISRLMKKLFDDV